MELEQLILLYNEKMQDVDEMLEAVLKFRQLLRDIFSQLHQRKLDLETKYRACAELHGNVKADGNDKIKLNVGGVKMVCKRSILTIFPSSKLAMLFSGRWDKKLLRDKKNRIFLDVDPLCFRLILDHLELCLTAPADAPLPLPEVTEDLKTTFDELCIFFEIFHKEQHTSNEEEEEKTEYVADTGISDHVDDHDDIDSSFSALKAALKAEPSLLDSMEQALVKDESRFAEEERFVNSFATGDTSDIVQLLVGVEVMTVRRSTLRLIEGSVLCCQFDGSAWRQGKRKREGEGEGEQDMASDSDDDEDVVLIEQPAYAFGKLVNQLRLMAITPPGRKAPRLSIAPQEESNFETVVQHYFPGQEQAIIPTTFSSIVDSKPHALLVQEWVQEAMSEASEVHLSLLYQASRDGFGASDFHRKCDNEDTTVTLVKTTEGFVFGGYSDQMWGSGGWKASSRAFLFSIVNPSGLAPMKLPLTGGYNNDFAVDCDPEHGPCFGSGHDLRICNESNTSKDSFCWLGSCYTLPEGQGKHTFLAGSRYFLVAEIEVFAVSKHDTS